MFSKILTSYAKKLTYLASKVIVLGIEKTNQSGVHRQLLRQSHNTEISDQTQNKHFKTEHLHNKTLLSVVNVHLS